jgi:gliding motility-associated-like protein
MLKNFIMKSLKITLFFILVLQSYLVKAQYSQGFEPVSGNSASIITILRNQCWTIDGLSVNAGATTPISGVQSFVTGTAANQANRGFITPYMQFDGSDSVAINYKYYGTTGNFQRWFLLKLISDIGQVTTIDSVFINTASNSIINFSKNISGFTGKFKIFINYRGSGNGITGSRTGFDDFFFSGNYFYPTGCVDTDFDGIIDTKDADDDNDGIADAVEVCGIGATNFSCLGTTPASSDPGRDVDGDGVVNFQDPQFCSLNSNGVCVNLDFDGDGIPNHLDLDSDNDGILDAIEANSGVAPANYVNGVINSPVGPNGMPNSAENGTNTGISNFPMTNTDTQGSPDFIDIDADNDGIVDNIEAQATAIYLAPIGSDSDRDGVDDAYDNQIGMIANGLLPVNTDNTDNADYADGDSDNDARTDVIEAHDSNGNSVQDGLELSFNISGIDSDNDGLDNSYDLFVGYSVTNSGQTANDFPNAQLGTAERDWRETPFVPEICNNGIDDDGDGFADCLDPDCGLPLIDSISIVNAGPCTNVSNGQIVVHAVNSTLYSIDNGLNFSNDSVFDNLASGFYTVVVQNSNGCTAQAANNPIEISSTNCAPIALDDNFVMNQNTTLNGSSLLANDNITDGPFLNINTNPINGPVNGNVTINLNGTFTYIPNNGFFGNDQFEYIVCDGASPELCDTALVTILVNQVNQLPNINNESFTTNINTAVSNNILINDSDPDGTLGVTTIPLINASNGIFSTDTSGNFTYTPNNGFTGIDTIVVLVCDNNGACENDTIFITIINNLSPVVANELITGNEDNSVTGNVLLNDSDLDGTINVNTTPIQNASNGLFNITSVGDFNYVPNLNFNGVDTVIVNVCDNLGACVNDTIFININPVNDLPIILNENITVQLNTPFNGNIIINDSDIEGALTSSILPLFGPLNGIITMNSSGDFEYTPNNGFLGLDLVWFQVCDIDGACVNDTIFINVVNQNIPPTVENDNVVTNEDTQASGNILNNDSDVDGTISVTITPLQTASNGVVIMNSNGTFTYTPDPNFFGNDVAIYEVCDNAGACINDTIFITINSVNDIPTVQNDFYTGNQNQSLNDNILINDSDLESVLTVNTVPIQNTINGIIAVQGNGDFTYIPNANFTGVDTAVFEVCDADGACINDTVFINILPLVNQPPVIVSEFYTMPGNTFISDNFLNNDSDIDGFLVITLSPTQDVLNGVLVYDNLGFFTYTPNIGFVGLDTAIIKICDDDLACSQDTLIFNVTPATILPIVNNDFFNVNEDASINGIMLSNDFSNQGILSATLLSGPSNGSISLLIDGQFSYTPTPNFNGLDTVITLVCDVNGVCINDTLFFTVLPVADPIIIVNEQFLVTANSSFNNNILTNDTDIDGSLSAIIPQLTGPTNGVILITSDGNFTYTPNNGFVGFDTVVVQVCSTSGPCINDTIIFNINIVNTPPDVNNETFTTIEETPLNGNILTNDSDLEGPVTVVSPPSIIIPFGTLNIDNAGNFSYFPITDFFGSFQVIIQVCDIGNLCENDTLTITVTPVNDLPVVNNESFSTTINVGINDNLLNNDSDIEGPLTANTVPISGPINGNIIISANGDFIYTPNFNFIGTDTIVVSVCDNDNFCMNDTIFITIPSGNTFPVVENESFNTIQDQTFVGNILTNDFDLETGLIVNTTPVVDLANGLIFIFANGAFTYSPNAGFVGNDFAVFSVCDLDGACVNDTVFFNVSPIANIPPDVFNDNYTVVQDGNLTDNLLLNDSDPDGTINANTNPIVDPTNGAIIVQSNGDFTYTPNVGFVGLDTVVVQVCDNSLACVNDTLFFNVIPINNLPIVQNDTITIIEDNNAISNILQNDSDPDGPVSASTIIIVNPAHGVASIDASGNYSYQPNSNYYGNDTIVFSVCDTDNNCINDTLFVTILPVNDNIVVMNDFFSTNENTPFSGNIISNDADPDGTLLNLTTTPLVLPANGIVIVNANGTFDYLPNAGFIGIDTIVVEICDSGFPLPATCANDTIFITVIDVNSPPVLVNENVVTDEDIAISGTVITVDNDPDGTALTVNTVPQFGPSNGVFTINQNGDYTYTPNINFNGIDTIVVQICDSGLPLPAACNFDTIIIVVNAVNDAPMVLNDTASTLSNQNASGNILLNDTDIENTSLSADSLNIIGPSNGIIILNSNGDFVYTPNTGFYGQDTIFIAVCDSGLPLPAICVTDTLIITINPIAAIANAGPDQNICVDSLALNGNFSPVGNGIWTVISGTANFADSSVFNTTAYNLSIGQNILTWSISSNSGITTDTVIVNVSASLAQPNAGFDKTICSFSDSLNALQPSVGVGMWSVLPGSSGIIDDVNAANTLVTSLGNGVNTFVWTVSNGICPSVSDTVVINVTPVPTLSAAGPDLQICGTSIQLNANAPNTGTGHWEKLNSATSIVDTLSAQTVVFNLTPGSNQFVWVIENGVCPANVDTVEIFSFLSSTTPVAGNDTTICQNQLLLNANVIDIGIGQWAVVSGTGTLSDFNLNNAQITNLSKGENILIWTSVNGVCPILSDTIIVQVQDCPDTTVFIPEGFSPNGDGTNDLFVISGINGANVSVQIFNRWGSKVYENNNYQNDWGGTNEDSKELLDATYYYIIKVDGEDKARTGYITVWR